MNAHIGEDAELYPLGLLDDIAARNVEGHVAVCVECARRVAAAQGVAASLAASLPEATPSPALERRLRDSTMRRISVVRYALAAAVALVVLGLSWQTVLMRQRLAADDVALVTMVHSHFNHVSMNPESANPVAAKILYARDGSWVYIIADKPGGTLHAIARSASGAEDLGGLIRTGETATLLVRPGERIASIVLQRGGTAVAAAKLTY